MLPQCSGCWGAGPPLYTPQTRVQLHPSGAHMPSGRANEGGRGGQGASCGVSAAASKHFAAWTSSSRPTSPACRQQVFPNKSRRTLKSELPDLYKLHSTEPQNPPFLYFPGCLGCPPAWYVLGLMDTAETASSVTRSPGIFL